MVGYIIFELQFICHVFPRWEEVQGCMLDYVCLWLVVWVLLRDCVGRY